MFYTHIKTSSLTTITINILNFKIIVIELTDSRFRFFIDCFLQKRKKKVSFVVNIIFIIIFHHHHTDLVLENFLLVFANC